MARIKWGKELENYASRIAKLGSYSGEICGKAVYDMAGIVADKIRDNLKSIHYISDSEGMKMYSICQNAEL